MKSLNLNLKKSTVLAIAIFAFTCISMTSKAQNNVFVPPVSFPQMSPPSNSQVTMPFPSNQGAGVLKRPNKDIDFVCVGSGIAWAEKVGERLNQPVTVFRNFGTAMIKYEGFDLEFVGFN